MVKNNPNPKVSVPVQNEEIDWEMRPGGMLVQKREDDVDAAASASFGGGPVIKIDVVHGPSQQAQYELFVPGHSTFGEVKRHVAQKTGLEPNEQKLFFRGKEKEDDEQLHVAGVKDNSKVLLMEERKPEEKKNVEEEVKAGNEVLGNGGEAGGANSNEVLSNDGGGEIGVGSSEMAKAFKAIAQVRAEVDKLSEGVAALEVAVGGGTKVSDKEFAVSAELLMRQLLKLDSIEAEGEAKMQRKAEVRRVQNFVDALDTLKARNSNPFYNSSNAASVTTKWETFDSGVGCLNPPTPMPSSAEVNQDWERFD